MEIELYFWGEILITLFEDDNELKHTLIISICHRVYAFFLDSINASNFSTIRLLH